MSTGDFPPSEIRGAELKAGNSNGLQRLFSTLFSLTPKECRKMETRSKLREARLRRKYREVHGEVVDFITHTIDDGTLYFNS
jgi:hypothetical protein